MEIPDYSRKGFRAMIRRTFRKSILIGAIELLLLAAPLASLAALFGQLPPANQAPPLRLGDPAPRIKSDKLLQGPAGASTDWKSLTGKWVVMEFWASWCSPCVAAIPHLNELATEFSGRPVVFISIASDDADQLEEFLKKTPVRGWIVVDPRNENWPAFDVHSIPDTVIVGRDGRVIAMTQPEHVTSQVLRDILEGKNVSLSLPQARDSDLLWDQDEIDWKDGVNPITEVIIKPIHTATSGVWPRPSGDYLTADGVSLSTLVQLAWQTDMFHVDLLIQQPNQLYRVAVRVPEDRRQDLLPLFQNSLMATFAFKARWQAEEKEVYVLRPRGDHKSKLNTSTAEETPLFQVLRGKATARRQPIAKLCEFLSGFVLHSPVVDDTGLAGDYDWDLPYQPGQPTLTLDLVKERLGLDLAKGQRSVKVLVVEPADGIPGGGRDH